MNYTKIDNFRFILCDPEDGLYEDMTFDEFDPESMQQKADIKTEHMNKLLEQVNFSEWVVCYG